MRLDFAQQWTEIKRLNLDCFKKKPKSVVCSIASGELLKRNSIYSTGVKTHKFD